MDLDSEKPDGARLSQAEIEAQVRDLYGAKLDACARFHAFGEEALYSWAGRGIDPQSVDPIIVVEAARQTKTYGGALRLAAGGFGPQASMLARSLFEGMAIVHWAHANPELAVERFKKHVRHSQLLWGDALEKAEPAAPREIDTGSDAERKELAALFGRHGTHLWTGHGSLHALMPDIEKEWLEGEPRKMLWWFFRIPQRDNNQVLHSTSLGLSGVASLTTEALGLDAGPSDYYLDRGLLGATWCYAQMMTLLWDHFAIPDRVFLDEVVPAQVARSGAGLGDVRLRAPRRRLSVTTFSTNSRRRRVAPAAGATSASGVRNMGGASAPAQGGERVFGNGR